MNARLFFHNCTAIRRIAAAATTTTARNTIRCFRSTAYDDDGGGGGVSSQRRRFQYFTTTLATGVKSFSSSCIFHNNNFSSKYNDNSSLLHGPAGGATLLKGLDIHTVQAEDDGHPLAVYTIQQQAHENNDDVGSRGSGSRSKRTPILLLHGRTWSSLPVYHLIGEATITTSSKGDGELGEAFPREVTDEENRSLLQALYNTQHIQPYAMDFRGFGGTPRTSSLSASTTGSSSSSSSSSSRISSGSSGGGFVEPLRCVMDAVSVLNWIRRRHHDHGTSEDDKLGASDSEGGGNYSNPALLGWSHGALIAQITAQRHPELVSKLVLYGSIYNPNVANIIPPSLDTLETPTNRSGGGGGAGGHTDHDDFPLYEMAARNEYDGAMEDFTNVGSSSLNNSNGDNEARIFPPMSARLFAKAALVCDPIKVQWKNLHQLNECQPQLVKVPTLVIAGDQDPFAPMSSQADLFTNLGRGLDKTWTIIANADHAVHLSDERHRFVANVNNFLRE